MVDSVSSEQEFNKVPEHGWTCFHCGEHFAPTFGGQQAARRHFGDSPIEQPACTIDARAFRAIQDLCAQYQSEDTELHREIQRLQADHAVALRREEETGYARAIRDLSSAIQKLAPDLADEIGTRWTKAKADENAALAEILAVLRRPENAIHDAR